MTVPSLDSYGKMAHETAVTKGFWDGEPTVDFLLSKLALVHSEISETLEAIRKNKGSNEIAVEIADTFIRLVDFYEGCLEHGYIDGVTLDEIVTEKMMVNSKRPRKHGHLA